MTATLQQKIKTQIKNNTNPFDIKIMLYPTQPHPTVTLHWVIGGTLRNFGE